MIDVFHPTKGRRRWPVTVWEKLSKDSDGTTRGGGWRVIASDKGLPEGEIAIEAKVSAAPIVKKKDVVVAPVEESKPDEEITDPNGTPEAIIVPEVVAEVVAPAAVPVEKKPAAKRKPSPRKKK